MIASPRWLLCWMMVLAGCATTTPRVDQVDDAITPGIFLEPEIRDVLPPGVALRPVYDKGLDVTRESEGFRSMRYEDSAHYCSIAYGHLIKRAPCDGSEPAEFLAGVSREQGSTILVADMAVAQRAVMLSINPEIPLTDGQFAALCDFVYNVGSRLFKKSTLLKVINNKEFDLVPQQLRRYSVAGNKVVEGLKHRREREITLFFDGLPTPRDAPPAGADLSPIDIRPDS